MTITSFWATTDGELAAAATAVRADRRLEVLYHHGVAVESWRRHLLGSALKDGLAFWQEAHNDFLLALMHGGNGVWRSSLQSLRSFLENATGAIYFSEHPVEARRFDGGTFRLTWTETREYLKSYPYASPAAFRQRLLAGLTNEYRELSIAVHGSSESFRMTAGRRFPALVSADPTRIGAWRTRTIRCARAVHLLLLQHFASHLQGARLPALRDDISRILTNSERRTIRQALSIVLPAP